VDAHEQVVEHLRGDWVVGHLGHADLVRSNADLEEEVVQEDETAPCHG